MEDAALGAGYMPHGHCYLWQPGLVSLHLVSDLLIGLAYFAISATIVLFLRRSRLEAPFRLVFVAFGLFIVTCGLTHLFSVWTLWFPTYWTSGAVKAATAVVSVGTAVMLPPLVPLALRTLRDARMSDQRREDLEAAHLELRGLYLRLQEMERMRSKFFADVSHELRTPLTLILGPTENLLASGSLSSDQRRDLEVVLRNGELLREHIDDLLDVARQEGAEMEPRFVRTDLARVLRNVCRGFEGAARERDLDFRSQLPERLPAEVDADKIQRVALNLVGNAFKYTPAGGVVRCELTTDQSGRTARLEVADSGPGIPPGERQSAFERFRRLGGPGAPHPEGVGLGLSIARDFARLHGGDVVVDEAPEGGARFVATFRLHAPEGARVRSREPGEAYFEPHEGRPSDRPAGGGGGGSNGGRPRVLVVEDNQAVNRFLAATLEEMVDVAQAYDGREALEKLEGASFDLVLTDLMMPVMGGDELVVRMRGEGRLQDVPIVVLTAREDQDLKVDLLRKGVQDYLTKPFSAEELRARVSNLVGAKRAREVLARTLRSQETDLEALARSVADAQQELHRALDESRVARRFAERASQVKTNFLRLMSHELRTPLTAMRLQLTLLQRNKKDPLTGSQIQAADRIARSMQRQAEIIETILEYARIESGRYELKPEPCNLVELADEVVADFEPTALQKGLELRRTGGDGLDTLRTDPELVRLILANLVGNAVKFTATGSVDVSLSADAPHQQRIVVSDTGPGIPEALQSSIFEPFQQLEDIRYTQEPGSGLGLALVKELVEALGGRIHLESREGEGTRFVVTLSSLQEEDVETEAEAV